MNVDMLDYLAVLIASKQRARQLGLRGIAREMGVSAATVGRLLKGSRVTHYPDLETLMAAAQWVGHRIDLVAAP